MSFFDEDFEEIDLNEELSTATTPKPSRFHLTQKKSDKKLGIPILNKTTVDPNRFEYEILLKQMNIHQTHVLDSNFIKTPSPRSDARKTIERLIFNHQLSENRKQFLRKEKEINELKSCTFSPQLSSKRSVLKKSNSQRQPLMVSTEENTQKHENNADMIKGEKYDGTIRRYLKNNDANTTNNSLKSRSQEHNNSNSEILTPRKDLSTREGRPPKPKKHAK